MKRVVCFYIKHTSFINTVGNGNSFQILFIICKTRKNARKIHFYRVLLPILLRKTRQRRGVTYDVIDELQRLSLSKCFPALCHKLIYEIVIFHSINRETCDKIIFIFSFKFINKKISSTVKYFNYFRGVQFSWFS